MERPSSPLASEITARVRALEEHHVPDIPWRQSQVLTLQAIGFSDADVAATLAISVATAQGLVYAGRRAVVPDGYRPRNCESQPLRADRRNATAWAWLHRSCCTATAFSALQIQEPAAVSRLSELTGRPFPALDGELSLVASLTACGLSDDEIARAMAVSTATVHRRHDAIVDAFAIDGVAVDLNHAAAAAWLHGECCGALPAEVLDAAYLMPPAPDHVGPHGTLRHASVAAFLRRARLVPLIAAMWIGTSMGAVISKRRRPTSQGQPGITAFTQDEPTHMTPKDP